MSERQPYFQLIKALAPDFLSQHARGGLSEPPHLLLGEQYYWMYAPSD
jgi:hypothetical protein